MQAVGAQLNESSGTSAFHPKPDWLAMTSLRTFEVHPPFEPNSTQRTWKTHPIAHHAAGGVVADAHKEEYKRSKENPFDTFNSPP